jgi:hypothetical protein
VTLNTIASHPGKHDAAMAPIVARDTAAAVPAAPAAGGRSW